MILGPVFYLFLGLSFGDSVGASAVGVLCASLSFTASVTRERIADLRISNLFLAAIVPGALVGATLVVHFANTPVVPIFLIAFGAVLLANVPGMLALRKVPEDAPLSEPDRLTRVFHLEGQYLDRPRQRIVRYRAKKVPQSMAVMVGAGLVSGLFGIGSGALVVLTLNRISRIPIKVATATSKYLSGVEIMASLGILMAGGLVQVAFAAPTIVGMTAGAYLGGFALPRSPSNVVRWIFLALILVFGIEEIWKGGMAL